MNEPQREYYVDVKGALTLDVGPLTGTIEEVRKEAIEKFHDQLAEALTSMHSTDEFEHEVTLYAVIDNIPAFGEPIPNG